MVSEDSVHYIINSTPKDKNDASGKLKYKVDKNNMTIREVTFYGRNGQALKRLNNLAFENIDDVPVVLNSEMENLRTGSVTLLARTAIQVGVSLFDDDFGPQPPQLSPFISSLEKGTFLCQTGQEDYYE